MPKPATKTAKQKKLTSFFQKQKKKDWSRTLFKIIYSFKTDNLFEHDTDFLELGASRHTYVLPGLASPAKLAKTKGGGLLEGEGLL